MPESHSFFPSGSVGSSTTPICAQESPGANQACPQLPAFPPWAPWHFGSECCIPESSLRFKSFQTPRSLMPDLAPPPPGTLHGSHLNWSKSHNLHHMPQTLKFPSPQLLSSHHSALLSLCHLSEAVTFCHAPRTLRVQEVHGGGRGGPVARLPLYTLVSVRGE